MRNSTKVAVAGAVLVLAGLGLWMLRTTRQTPAGPSPAPKPPAVTAPEPRTEVPSSSTHRVIRVAAAPSPSGVAPRRPAESRAPPPAPLPAEEPPDAPAGAGEVAGVVLLLPDRTPLSCVKVSLLGGGPGREAATYPAVTSATTGPSGRFRFGTFPAGDYLFEAKAEGRLRRLFRTTVSAAAGADVEVLFGSGGAIEGKVGASGGSAVAGAAVQVEGEIGGLGLLETRTAADGTYRLGDIPPGHYGVRVQRERGTERFSGVQVEEGKTARLDFPGGTSLAGAVTDGEGAAVANAIVRPWRIHEGRYMSRQTNTDGAGQYRVEDLEPGEWRIGIQVLGAAAFSSDVASRTLAEGENRFDVQLDRGDLAGSVSGRVYAKATGAGLSSRDVQLTLSPVVEGDLTGMAGTTAMAFADPSGNYRFRAVRPGRYKLWASSFRGHRDFWSEEFDLASGQRLDGFDIALEPAPSRPRTEGNSSLAGTVRDESGRPVAKAFLTAVGGPDGKTTRESLSDDAGQYRITGLEPGPWRVGVLVLGDEGRTVNAGTVTVVAGENRFPIEFPGGEFTGEIAGRVVAQGSRKPLTKEEAIVGVQELVPDGKGGWTVGAGAGFSFLGADGGYRIRFLRAGRYRIVASPRKGGLRAAQAETDLAPGQALKDVEIAMEEVRSGSVRYVVRDAEGKPVTRVQFRTIREEGGAAHDSEWDCNSGSGDYVLHYEPGPRRVRVTARDETLAAEVAVTVREGETERVDVPLRPVDTPR